VVGDKLYAAYNPFNDGTLQILDLNKFLRGDPAVAQPLKPTPASVLYPQISRLDMPTYWGVHTAKAILGMKIPDYRLDKAGSSRDILVLVSEGASVGCDRARHLTFFLDITEPAYPVPISTYQADAAAGNFCNRQIYFGPHNIQSQEAPPYAGKLLFVTYFGGGLRVVDIRNPFRPVEVGHYIPSANSNTHYEEYKGPWKGATFEQAPLTNDVTVDSRGYIYITDRADTGLHILALTGRAAQVVQ
jgi:hypothetical protein